MPTPETNSPGDLAQRQLDAYNAHDLDAFVACYAEGVRVLDLPSHDEVLRGREALRARFGPYFEDARPHAIVTHRKVVGTMVVDEEVVTRNGDEHLTAIAIYEVTGGLIQTVWFIRG